MKTNDFCSAIAIIGGAPYRSSKHSELIDAVDEASDAMLDAARAFLEVEPTSLEGAAAILKYVARGGDDDWTFPEHALDDDDEESDAGFKAAVMHHVAEALSKMGAETAAV